jgi:sugar/nucleoside kinase (ribokinase family)
MRPLGIAGNVNVDLILGPAAAWPQPGTEVTVAHSELRVGGAAGNTALAWKAMGIDFQAAGNLGNDHFSRWLANEFAPLSKSWPVGRYATTLSVGITHPDGERTFFTTGGHLDELTLADTLASLDHVRLAGGLLLLCGPFFTTALTRDYDRLYDWAECHQVDVALDTGWPPKGWTEAVRSETLSWFAKSRIALLNEVETTALTGQLSAEAAGRALKAMMPADALVVVKRGSEGAIAIDQDGTLVEVSAPRIHVIDTIGAGDVFNAGFLAALAKGSDLPACLRSGVSLASRAVSTNPRVYEPAAEEGAA